MKWMKLNFYAVVTVFLVLFLAGCTSADTKITANAVKDIDDKDDNTDKVIVYFFWGDGCPHCDAQKPFLEQLEKKHPEVRVKMFETWKNPENAALFREVASAYGFEAQGVPTTFIGEEHWVGFADYIGAEMESRVEDCIVSGCINPEEKLK